VSVPGLEVGPYWGNVVAQLDKDGAEDITRGRGGAPGVEEGGVVLHVPGRTRVGFVKRAPGVVLKRTRVWRAQAENGGCTWTCGKPSHAR
jgi:hypothetical protein